jgi:hypothetical protein
MDRMNRLIGLMLGIVLALLPGHLVAENQSSAFLAQQSCSAFVRNFGTEVVFGVERGLVLISADGQIRTYHLGQAIRDVVLIGDDMIALVGQELLVIDRKSGAVSGRYPTQHSKAPAALMPEEFPRSLSLADRRVLIAHGTLGVSVFDWPTRQLGATVDLNQDGRVKVMVQDVVVRDSIAYLLVDNFQVSPVRPSREFRGLVLLDLLDLIIVQRLNGLDPGATALALAGDTILVSFSGSPVWRLKLPLNPEVSLSKVARPIMDFGIPGHPVGRFFADLTSIWACHRSGRGGGSIPAIYSRATLRL